MAVFYDPPDGWRYGFPKPFTPGENLRLALIRDGYPPRLIDDVVLNHCRFIGPIEELERCGNDPLVASDCHLLDGKCDCKSMKECKYG